MLYARGIPYIRVKSAGAICYTIYIMLTSGNRFEKILKSFNSVTTVTQL